MKFSGNQFTHATARMASAAALVATLAFAPGVALAIDKDAHMDRAELRILSMHDKLKITSSQEEQWAKVSLTMRENAKTMDVLSQTRSEQAKDMNAVDDLKSYGEIAAAHADGIKQLTPVFATLYASMSDTQKAAADNLFRHGEHQRAHHKSGHKTPEVK